MKYYLRTLEGVGRCFGGVLFDEFYNRFSIILSSTKDRKLATFNALKQMREIYKDADFSEIYQAIDERYNKDPNNYYNVYEGKEAFLIDESRKKQQAQAQEDAQRQAEAIAEAERAQKEAERAEAERLEQEEEAKAAAAEIRRYEELREEIAADLEYINNGQIIIYTPEALQIYKELTGRDYSEVLARHDEAREAYESEVKMQEENKSIEISPVIVSSGHEYTIIEEDENSITYQDETGEIHIEQKAGSVWPWVLAGAAALFFLV